MELTESYNIFLYILIGSFIGLIYGIYKLYNALKEDDNSTVAHIIGTLIFSIVFGWVWLVMANTLPVKFLGYEEVPSDQYKLVEVENVGIHLIRESETRFYEGYQNKENYVLQRNIGFNVFGDTSAIVHKLKQRN